ncbi:hypothetical protein QA639_21185 [Bradyrhizobium pachyrhizi]|uniref:hypothetical protein n=1 Tax=Bradyrhizobium pachyrhizi TaxID=280333 RepID=UPI0024B0B72C|nr:hypothetical protein [Bradyrhizobium pachyrhizi]WFU52224.1 hypothetical protein QA639_21185 [Bradyrhizobium pachyrhizi]
MPDLSNEQIELVLWAIGMKQTEARLDPHQPNRRLSDAQWAAIDALDARLNEKFAGKEAADELAFLVGG